MVIYFSIRASDLVRFYPARVVPIDCYWYGHLFNGEVSCDACTVHVQFKVRACLVRRRPSDVTLDLMVCSHLVGSHLLQFYATFLY